MYDFLTVAGVLRVIPRGVIGGRQEAKVDVRGFYKEILCLCWRN